MDAEFFNDPLIRASGELILGRPQKKTSIKITLNIYII